MQITLYTEIKPGLTSQRIFPTTFSKYNAGIFAGFGTFQEPLSKFDVVSQKGANNSILRCNVL